MTDDVDGGGMPEISTWTYACTLKDLLLLSPLQVVAAQHFPDHLPQHHSDISIKYASLTAQSEREGHNEELDRMDVVLRCA